jgi:hypothetical protein
MEGDVAMTLVDADLTQSQRDEAMRILGARDGYAHALINVRTQISNIMSIRIDDRHTRLLAARDEKLRPLIVLREIFERHARECSDAHKRRMSGDSY